MLSTGSTEYNAIGAGGLGGLGAGLGGGVGLIGLIGLQDLFNKDRKDGGVDNVAEFRAIAGNICDVKSQVAAQFNASQMQAYQIASAAQAQATAFQSLNDNKFEGLSRQIAADGDQTRALINANTIQDLRDQVLAGHRATDAQAVTISINNAQAQSQAQLQAQSNDLFTHLRTIIDQNARAENSLINIQPNAGNRT